MPQDTTVDRHKVWICNKCCKTRKVSSNW